MRNIIHRKFPKLTFGRAVAGTAILMLLTSGAAYAANEFTGANIKNGTITTKDVKNNNLKSKDIKNNNLKSVDIKDESLTSADILDETITSADILDDTITADDLASNSVGQPEIQIDGVAASEIADNSIDAGEIIDGSLRASDLGTITQRSATSAPIGAGGNGSVTANCLAGERVLSGGNDGFFDVFVVASRRQANGWSVFAHNNSGGNRTITAHAYCLAS